MRKKKFKTRISVDVDAADVVVDAAVADVDVDAAVADVDFAAVARTLIDHAETFINMEIASETNFSAYFGSKS